MKKIIYIILFLITAICLFIFLSQYKINVIECQTQLGPCPITIKPGKYNQIKKDLENAIIDHPSIQSYTSQIKLPNKLQIYLIVKKPVYSINKANTQNFIFVDNSGYVVGIGDQSDLINLIIEDKLENTGQTIDSKKMFALNILSGLNSMYQIKSGEIKNNSLVVELDGGINVIFPLDGNTDTLLGSLRLIYEKIGNGYNGKFFNQIDLRFKNPYLK